jgi:hypothetical protein
MQVDLQINTNAYYLFLSVSKLLCSWQKKNDASNLFRKFGNC